MAMPRKVDIAEAAAMRAAGRTVTAIAAHFKASEGAVRAALFQARRAEVRAVPDEPPAAALPPTPPSPAKSSAADTHAWMTEHVRAHLPQPAALPAIRVGAATTRLSHGVPATTREVTIALRAPLFARIRENAKELGLKTSDYVHTLLEAAHAARHGKSGEPALDARVGRAVVLAAAKISPAEISRLVGLSAATVEQILDLWAQEAAGTPPAGPHAPAFDPTPAPQPETAP